MPQRTASTAGFSLVELSIVLVILGLLVGGILAGQSLIRAAEMRSITTEKDRYVTAISAFRDKYLALPGDIRNTNNFANITEQGDGNGQVNPTAATGTNEIYAFWENLAGAGLAEGTYTPGVAYSATSSAAGTTNPRSRLANAGWNVGYIGAVATNGANTALGGVTYTSFFAKNYNNALTIGGGTNAYNPTAILKPEEAWNVDTKVDDGRPDNGNVLSLNSQHTAAATAGRCTFTNTTIQYQLSDAGTNCSLVFLTGY